MRCARAPDRLAALVCGWRPVHRHRIGSQREGPWHPCPHGLWRRRTCMARGEVASAARLDSRRFGTGRGLDSEAAAMKRPTSPKPACASADLRELAECVEKFSGKTIVLLGDFVADEFRYGDISRVSREAPVLILMHRESHVLPGGGANATNNLASLGAKVLPITVVGGDHAGDALIQYFRGKGISTGGILRAKGRATPTKTRFLAGWAHTVAQQVLRCDYEPGPLPEGILRKIQQKVSASLQKADALAISDYGFGVATPELVRQAAGRLKRSVPITLDARYQLHAYAKSGITSATPNEAELEADHQTTIGPDAAELARAGRRTLSATKLQALLATRGRHGSALFESEDRLTHIPIHGSDQAVDVTGAGDTVLAAYTLALASGAKPLAARHMANIAGGRAVIKRGTATVSRQELLDAIRGEISGAAC